MSQVHIIVISTGKYLKIFVSVFFLCAYLKNRPFITCYRQHHN